jgi:hypothetical protein
LPVLDVALEGLVDGLGLKARRRCGAVRAKPTVPLRPPSANWSGGTIVDATLIEARCSTKNQEKAQDRRYIQREEGIDPPLPATTMRTHARRVVMRASAV